MSWLIPSDVCKNPLLRVLPVQFGVDWLNSESSWACADQSFTSVYVTHVNNVIFPFSLWYRHCDNAVISAGSPPGCWQKRQCLFPFPSPVAATLRPPHTCVRGDARHTPSDLCHAGSSVYSTPPQCVFGVLRSARSLNTHSAAPRKGQVHQGNVVWSCILTDAVLTAAEAGANDPFPLPVLDASWCLGTGL